HNIEAMARANKGGVWVSNAAKSGHMMKIDRRAAPYAYKMGLTVYLDDVTAGLPGARSFCRQIEADLGLPPDTVRATGWASPSASGATCHYDTDDIISVQLRGTKRFDLAPMPDLPQPTGRQYSPGTRLVDETYPQMVNGFPTWQDAAFESLEMAPGSVLFFQRGTWHRTHSGGDSLSISFVLEPPTAAECVLRQLRDVMLQDPRWRKPLYGAWGSGPRSEAAHRETGELLAQVPEIARVIAPRNVAMAFMSEEQRLALIDRESRFQRIPNAAIVAGTPSAEAVEADIVHRQEDGSEQRLATLTVPSLGLDALNWIAAQDAPFRMDALAAEFPAIPFDGLRRLLESSAKAGLVKMLWFPALGDRGS
ncbi:MAG: JmjC domain-containing protein, partial [Paracoccaceae bacterium]